MEHVDPVLESIARDCARCVRGCTTDEQYRELVLRIARALQAERDDHPR
jgi:hypothetical protein